MYTPYMKNTRRANNALCLVLAAAALAAACDEYTAPTSLEGDASGMRLEIVSGNNQSAPVGTELSQPLVVRAFNSAGNPIANQIINFRVTLGGGSVFAGTAKTNANGYAREWWTLGPAAGLNRIEARAVDAATGERLVFGVFEATGTSGVPTDTTTDTTTTPPPTPVVTTVTVTPDSSSIQTSQTVQLSAAVRDQNGQPMTATVSWSSLNPGIANVNANGLVTGASAGTARIVGATSGKADTAKVVVTSVTPPPPPPSGSIFAEGFETNSFGTWDDGYDPSTHRIVTTGGAHTGNSYLEITYPAGSSEGGGWLTKMFNAGYDSVHFSYWVRFPTTWTGGSYLMGLYGSPVSNPWAGYGKAGVCPNGSDYTNHFLYVDGSGSPGPLTFYTYHMDMQGGCYGDEGAGRATYGSGRVMSRGVWHRVELQVRLNTPGSADGWERMYIDGAMQGEWRNLRQRTTTGLKITSLQISANNSGSGGNVTRTINIDDISVSPLGATPGGPGGGGGTDTSGTGGTPAPVATVTVTPNPASVPAGSTVQLTAQTRDAGGNTLTGRVVTWSSSNTAVATVNGSGVVTGVAAGSATITATSEGQSGSSAVTVTAVTTPPPSGNAAFTNEPAGFTAMTNNPWDALGTGGWAHANRDSRSQITADASAPLSPSNVLEMLYPQGYTGGGEPAIEEYIFRNNPTEVFVGMWVKFSPNWQGHSSGINKIANVMTNAGFGRTWIVLRAVGER
ncbi:MAG TPA: Ig-like domain-containing protein, partial [Gemmatimonadaceae bacterium]|nr:Ig-like domain-containing protein [Gemmatimonadaceae bacterium]